MRKIEQQMNDAVANNKTWQSANTSVHYNEENGVSVVRLHGNKIAEIGDDFLQIFDGVGNLTPLNRVSMHSSTASVMLPLMVYFKAIFSGTFVTTM